MKTYSGINPTSNDEAKGRTKSDTCIHFSGGTVVGHGTL